MADSEIKYRSGLLDKLVLNQVRAQGEVTNKRREEREKINREIMQKIDSSINATWEAVWRLKIISPPYSKIDVSDKKQRLMGRIETLEKEKRQEKLRFWRDLSESL